MRVPQYAVMAGALAACAGAPPCPQPPAPFPIAATGVPDCVGRGFPGRIWPSVARYPSASTDSARGPDRVIVGPSTALCGPRAIARGPGGEIYVLNFAVLRDSSRQVPPDLDFTKSPFEGFMGPQREPLNPITRPSWSAWITVYDSSAIGDIPPIRTLHIQGGGYTAPTTLAVDAEGYVYVGSSTEYDLDSGSIAVFAPDADGNVLPVRRIGGPATGVRSPIALAVAPHGFAYVANLFDRPDDTVRVFAPDAEGNTAPCRVLGGEKTGLRRPVALAVGRRHHLFVVGGPSPWHPKNVILAYDREASGDVAPQRVITGSAERIFDGMYAPRHMATGVKDSLYVRSIRNLSVFAPSTSDSQGPARTFHTNAPPEKFALDRHDTLYAVADGIVKVYPPGYAGVGDLVRTIGGVRTGIRSVSGIAVDSRGWLYLADPDSSLIRAFSPGAAGDVPPARVIRGWLTGLRRMTAIAVDDEDRLFVTNGPARGGGGAIRVYAPSARGEDRPVRVYRGVESPLPTPSSFAFDSRGDKYVALGSQIAVFGRHGSEHDPPIRTLEGPNTGLRRPSALAFGVGDTLYALNAPRPLSYCRNLGGPYGSPEHAVVTVYGPMASGDVVPVRRIDLPGVTGLMTNANYIRQGLEVDSTGALRVRYGAVVYTIPSGAEGATQPVRTTVEAGPAGTEGSSVVGGEDGWTYQTNVPRARILC